jgi:hypothetical protein
MFNLQSAGARSVFFGLLLASQLVEGGAVEHE